MLKGFQNICKKWNRTYGSWFTQFTHLRKFFSISIPLTLPQYPKLQILTLACYGYPLNKGQWGPQRPPQPTKVHQAPPNVNKFHQVAPRASKDHQEPPRATKVHQVPPNVTKGHQKPPRVTKGS